MVKKKWENYSRDSSLCANHELYLIYLNLLLNSSLAWITRENAWYQRDDEGNETSIYLLLNSCKMVFFWYNWCIGPIISGCLLQLVVLLTHYFEERNALALLTQSIGGINLHFCTQKPFSMGAIISACPILWMIPDKNTLLLNLPKNMVDYCSSFEGGGYVCLVFSGRFFCFLFGQKKGGLMWYIKARSIFLVGKKYFLVGLIFENMFFVRYNCLFKNNN